MTAYDEDERIRTAMEELHRLIVARVGRERRLDHLTDLPNGLALVEAINRHLGEGRHLWAAFVEIDKFKSVNDRFGYENADELLKAVAGLLRDMARSFPGDAQAFRQHGDEFFLVGATNEQDSHRADAIASLLELTRQKVKTIAVPVHSGTTKSSKPMSCTVSIGWMVSSDGSHGVLTARKVLGFLERATDAAKRTRDAVSRYSPELERRETVPLRADCACGTKFTADVPKAANQGPFHCPNCGTSVERPPTPNDGMGEEPLTLDV